MTDFPLFAALERYPSLLYLVALVAALHYVGKVLAESSDTWAKVLGPLGRRWRSRAVRDIERRKHAHDVQVARTAHQEAIAEDLQRQIDYLNPRIELLYAEVASLHDYLAVDAGWHARAEVHLATLGVDVPPPPHQTYREWRDATAQRQEGDR